MTSPLPRLMRFDALGGLTIALTILLLAGCQSVNTVQPDNPVGRPSAEQLERITTNPGMTTRIDSVYTGRQNGLLRVQVNMINTSVTSKGFRWQVRWFDEQGLEIYEPSAGWKRQIVEGGDRLPITSTAPSPEAVDWRVSVAPWDRG